mmetsp:Transcript_43404/g.77907  ORF Transcript_43404/g.77907 Transcript_43404/m.77907 type:complete len:700 (-) Transcript_43404:34-2133(-)
MMPVASDKLLLTLLAALSVSCCAYAHAGTGQTRRSSASRAAAAAPPAGGLSNKSVKGIQMVTTTLQDILDNVAAEEKQEEKLHGEAQKACTDQEVSLSDTINTTERNLKNVKEEESRLSAKIEVLTKRIKDNTALEEEAKDQMAQSEKIRTEEKDKYDEEMQLNQESINQVTKAIEHVQKVQKSGGFLQNGVLQKLQLNEPGESGYVLGVMKQISTKLLKTKGELEADEAEKVKNYDELMKKTGEQLVAYKASIDKDRGDLTQTQIDKNEATREVTKADEELQKTIDQLAKLKADCTEAILNYKATSKDRAKEKAALTEAVRYLQTELSEFIKANVTLLLNTDDGDEEDSGPVALASSEGLSTSGEEDSETEDASDDSEAEAQASPTFLQVRKRSAAISRSSRGGLGVLSDAADAEFLGLGTGLDAHQQKETFDSVNKVVAGLIKANRASQQEESDKFNYCKKELASKTIAEGDSNDQIMALNADIALKVAKVDTLEGKVNATEDSIEEDDKAADAAKKVRKEQKTAYEAQAKDRALAVKVLDQAKKVLSEFYDKKSEAGKGRKDIQSYAAIDLLEQISRDVSQEQMDSLKEEKEAETAYEQLVADTRDAFDRKMSEITEHKKQKAQLSVQINALTEELASEQQAFLNIKAQLKSLKEDCDDLIKTYEERKKARFFEVEQLRDVQDILAGSSLAVRTGS